MADTVACPLCAEGVLTPSWFGTVEYRGRRFEYLGCGACGSLCCCPMPDEATLEEMYGGEEVALDSAACCDVERVTRQCASRATGILLDCGCGNGEVLRRVASIGWRAVGVEHSASRPRFLRQNGLDVRTADELARDHGLRADVLHLGDVLEHLVDVGPTFEALLSRVVPGGLVVAQGPLQGEMTLQNRALAAWRRLSASRRHAEVEPQHVLLATRGGQLAFFERFGLETVELDVWEVHWPGPDRISLADLRRPRSLALYGLASLSGAWSRHIDRTTGNRFYYVGRKVAT